ncbi:MAG: methyltransferase, TIGR04325 family [Deltaproteobacteria bacterium]|nr:methyltransferase, TIGR04325 family [Deltaproteobacteria bacterium]
MRTKELFKQLIPPLVIRSFQTWRSRETDPGPDLSGDYPSWSDAMAASSSYQSTIILDRTKAALLKVRSGEANFERDSVLFDEIQYSWPLLAGLMWAAARSGGRLNVLDFGGSLGTTYFQNRVFLAHLPGVRWNIVEQPRHVAAGKEFFEDEQLRFYESVDDCLSETGPNALILSGVLQYLERPYEVLGELLRLPIDHVIIDRSPFSEGLRDRLCVQRVPPRIYPASYPIWIFSRGMFLQHITSSSFQIVEKFPALDRLDGPIVFRFEGMILARVPKV